MPKKYKFREASRYPIKCLVKKNGVFIRFPKSVAKYMNITENIVFWTPINGLIQLSGACPDMAIPVLKLQKTQFVPK